ncbi:TonB-dependent receptor domain-containing protein [Achromobacter xylosoxidans]
MHKPRPPGPRRRFPIFAGARASRLPLASRLALAGLGASVALMAQAQHADRQYDIPAGPLADALSRYAQQSDIALSVVAEQVAGRQSPGLHGRYALDEGFAALLRGTGLQARRGAAGYVLVAAPGAVALAPVVVRADALAEREVYTAPRSSVYLSSRDIDRFGRVSAGDLLAGIPGVQVGDSRNGGALDVNIRGIQGQSRVAVRVDGSEQALDVYRGYAGTQQRSYIDPDLISDVTVNKGPSVKSGAIGGSVEMRTLGVRDILTEGSKIGVRLKGDLWNNGVAPQHRTGRPPVSEWDPQESLFAVPHASHGGLFGSAAKSGSVAFAYTNDRLDIVAAYAHRNQGNYFSGAKGRERYRTYSNGYERNSVAKVYNPGEEVLNSSAETESTLLKLTLRPAEGHTLELGYRRYDGKIGEIMPSEIFRSGMAGISQYPLGQTEIDTYTARYRFQPADNPLLDLTANLWTTDARTSQLTSVWAPASQAYRTDRNWTRQADRRIGGGLTNTSTWLTAHGDFKLELGGSFQLEDIRPQRGVVTTQQDINGNRTLRDASRREFSLDGKLEYRPVKWLTLWGGGRYSHFNVRDNNRYSTARREMRTFRTIMVRKPGIAGQMEGGFGYMTWFPDKDGNYTDATDPRLHNGIVFGNDNRPEVGVPYNDFGASSTKVYPVVVDDFPEELKALYPDIYEEYLKENPDEYTRPIVTGYDFSPPQHSSGGSFAPALGLNVEWAPDTFVYASYTQGLRLPSLFETSLGTLQVTPGQAPKPERSNSWEFGASTMRGNLLVDGDAIAAKVAYFNNNIKNYIMRYYDHGVMQFRNTDNYKTSGLEFQSRYDAGRVFADLAATYYLKTETCDAAFAQKLRDSAGPYQRTENTPTCTPGSFMGSYTNTQNPPRLAVSLTSGLRFFNETLTLGGRMTYTSGPTATADKPWQTAPTTPQIVYQQVTLFDLFMTYQLRKHTRVSMSVQNLTNRYYLDPLAQSYMSAPGRTWRIGLQTRF